MAISSVEVSVDIYIQTFNKAKLIISDQTWQARKTHLFSHNYCRLRQTKERS